MCLESYPKRNIKQSRDGSISQFQFRLSDNDTKTTSRYRLIGSGQA